jgi:NitT/TauT family transport system substrate-binding protein
MHLPRSRALRVLGGALAAPALAGLPSVARSQSMAVVRVGVIPVDVSGNAFYAADLGLFKKAGLDVQMQPMASGPVLAQAVAGGALDIGISNVATIGAARLRGLPFRFIAPAAVVVPAAKQTDIVMVRKDSPIKSGADMNGKTIAINGLRDLQEIEAKGWVDRYGGDSKTVKFVEIPFPAMGGALEQNRADIIFPTEPFSTADQSVGKQIGIAFDGVAPRFMLLGWFANEAWLSTHGDVAAKWVRAIREASIWANAHHAESAKMLAAHTRVTEDVADKMVRATYGLDLDPTQLVPVLDLALRYGLIDRSVPVSELIWRAPKA